MLTDSERKEWLDARRRLAWKLHQAFAARTNAMLDKMAGNTEEKLSSDNMRDFDAALKYAAIAAEDIAETTPLPEVPDEFARCLAELYPEAASASKKEAP